MRSSLFVDYAKREVYDYKAVYQQGELDGACGLYSLMMALNLCGLIDPDFDGARPSQKTALGQLMEQLDELPNMFPKGITVNRLKKMLKNSYPNVSTDTCKDRGLDVFYFIIEHIFQGHPVILGLVSSDNYGHWVTAAGLEYRCDIPIADEEGYAHTPTEDTLEPERLFLLDSSSSYSEYCLWNNLLFKPEKVRGPFPYALSDGTRVQLHQALAIWL